MIRIIVASENPQKIQAVATLVPLYPFLAGATVIGKATASGVSEQPQSLEETVQGAKNRALAVFADAEYSFGIESGLMQVPHTKTGIMDVCVCAIYDGTEFHLGLSSAFEPPKVIVDLMHTEGLNMSEATKRVGLTQHENIGYSEGLIGLLTHGRLTRLKYTCQAVTTALIHLENAQLYKA